jgi:hypothetical protein
VKGTFFFSPLLSFRDPTQARDATLIAASVGGGNIGFVAIVVCGARRHRTRRGNAVETTQNTNNSI